MHQLNISSHDQRRARTRSLIQLGGLLEKAGVLDTFEITLGLDLQSDPSMKEPIAALYKALLDLNQSALEDQSHFALWAQQGLETLRKESEPKRKK